MMETASFRQSGDAVGGERDSGEERLEAEQELLREQLSPFVNKMLDSTVGKYQVVQNNTRLVRDFLPLCKTEVEALLFEVARFQFKDLAAMEREKDAQNDVDVDEMLAEMQSDGKAGAGDGSAEKQDPEQHPSDAPPPAADPTFGDDASPEKLKRQLQSAKASELYIRSLSSEMIRDVKAKATKIETLQGLVQRRDLLLQSQKRAYLQENTHLREMIRQFREYGKCTLDDVNLYTWDEDKVAQQQQEEVDAKVQEALADAKQKYEQEKELMDQRHAKTTEELKRQISLLEVQINALTVPVPKTETGTDAMEITEMVEKVSTVSTHVQTEGDVVTTMEPHPPLPAPPTQGLTVVSGSPINVVDGVLEETILGVTGGDSPAGSQRQTPVTQGEAGTTQQGAGVRKSGKGKGQPVSARPGSKASSAGKGKGGRTSSMSASALSSPTLPHDSATHSAKDSNFGEDESLKPFSTPSPTNADNKNFEEGLLDRSQPTPIATGDHRGGAASPTQQEKEQADKRYTLPEGSLPTAVMFNEMKQELVHVRTVMQHLRQELDKKEEELDELRLLRSEDRARFTKQETQAVRKLNEELRHKSNLLDTKTGELEQLRGETERWFAAYKQTQPTDSAPVNHSTIRKLTTCVAAAEEAEARYRSLSWSLMDTCLRFELLKEAQRQECQDQFKEEPTNTPALAKAQLRCDILDNRARQVLARIRQKRQRAKMHANRCWDVVLFYARNILHPDDPGTAPPHYYAAITDEAEHQQQQRQQDAQQQQQAVTPRKVPTDRPQSAGVFGIPKQAQVPWRLRNHVKNASSPMQEIEGVTATASYCPSKAAQATSDETSKWMVSSTGTAGPAKPQRPATAGTSRGDPQVRHVEQSSRFNPSMLRGLTPQQQREELVRLMRTDQQQLFQDRKQGIHQQHAARNLMEQYAAEDVEAGIYKSRLVGVPKAAAVLSSAGSPSKGHSVPTAAAIKKRPPTGRPQTATTRGAVAGAAATPQKRSGSGVARPQSAVVRKTAK